jgi:hypothetical protein
VNAESVIRAAVTERVRRQQILADSSKSFSFTGILTRGAKDVAVYNRAFEIFAAAAVAPEPLLGRYTDCYIDRLRAPRSSS